MKFKPIKQKHPIFDLGWLNDEIVRVSCVPKQRHFARLTANDFRKAFAKAIKETIEENKS